MSDHAREIDSAAAAAEPVAVVKKQSEPAGAARPQSEADVLLVERPAGGEAVLNRMLALQQSSGNRNMKRMLARQQPAQADPAAGQANAPAAAAAGATAAVDYQQLADDYEADAMAYWVENMEMELEAAAGSEGSAIGRRAGGAAAAEVRKTCEPYEEDQENDTNTLNTIFAITGGGLTISEGKSSGTTAGGSGTANMTSRAVRAAMGIVSVWLPTLAGLKTVGALKAAASRQAEETGAQGGEGGSASFGDYQTEALKQLKQDFDDEVSHTKQTIIADKIDQAGIQMAKGLFPTFRSKYLDKLRKEYGASSPVGESVQESIVAAMAPKMAELKKALDAAKEKRQTTQKTAAIGGGIVGGAVTGAAIGGFLTSWTGPGALIGAGIGAVAGGIIGGIGSLFIGSK